MRSIVVCIFGLMPLVTLANNGPSLDISTLWAYHTPEGTQLITEQKSINVDENNNFTIQTNLSKTLLVEVPVIENRVLAAANIIRYTYLILF